MHPFCHLYFYYPNYGVRKNLFRAHRRAHRRTAAGRERRPLAGLLHSSAVTSYYRRGPSIIRNNLAVVAVAVAAAAVTGIIGDVRRRHENEALAGFYLLQNFVDHFSPCFLLLLETRRSPQ
jgi:hypothetical protein